MMYQTYVYFIRPVGMDGPVKIGCSDCPETRLRAFQPSSPFKLEIVAKVVGGTDLERRFHAMFEDDRSHCEWFRPSARMSATISALRGGSFNFSALPPPKDIRARCKMTPEAITAGSYSRRASAMERRGVQLPPHVKTALHTYRQSPEEIARRRAVVREFVDAWVP